MTVFLLSLLISEVIWELKKNKDKNKKAQNSCARSVGPFLKEIKETTVNL